MCILVRIRARCIRNVGILGIEKIQGVNQLQQLLRAFCLHNPGLGYCQGMNFVAGTCLLFLSPEVCFSLKTGKTNRFYQDTFWFLIALTERYFVPSYFDNALTGAQADQEILKELMMAKLPRLAEHLEKCDIGLFYNFLRFNQLLN